MTIPGKITPLDGWMAKKLGILNDRLTREELTRYQLLKLNDTINRARNLSPFYRQHLADVQAERLNNLEEFPNYPLLTPADVASHALKMTCVPQSQISRVVTINTSGTTGTPKQIYFSLSDQELTVDFFQCGMSTFLTKQKDKALILFPGERPGSLGDLIFKALKRLGVDSVIYNPADDLAGAVATMRDEKISCLIGFPVQILAMARYWEKLPFYQKKWAPRVALLSADYVPEIVVKQLRLIWNCEVYEHYGMTEMGLGGGLECAIHDGYHLREDDIYFEVIDPVSANPLPDGEYGEIVFTTLTRRAMPLIRYRTGDISRFMTKPCPCGSVLRRLEKVCCRQAGLIRFSQNKEISMADLDEALLAIPEAINFTAEIICGDITKLKIGLTVLNNPERQEISSVLNVLRQIPVVRAAEDNGKLTLDVEIINYQDKKILFTGKRKIQTIGMFKEERGNAGQ